MNKQQLLNYFQTHYLSRQEVLFRLPLNVSIDTFWPELLNWRKGHAAMLPLYTTSGKPCWVVTTDKMARASECLCEEAMKADGSFDPYRVQMTPAMSQEAYFTSFVEGAEYPLEEAVAFLRRGTDPENMYEQNILNNHQAWSYMLSSLNGPFGEQFVKDLAFYLTEGQNDGSIDYRQEDSAEIPAMEGEDYDVPPAFSLPERMAQLYHFLADNSVHPLIKAAAAQAWIFAVRPFPEANERLARMISSAVLLRCGYEYFLDISISANIAHESYRYFKAIKETIRSENDGDLTYFVEYYIQLLARALAANKETRQQEALEAERRMAMQPLAPSPPVFHEESHPVVPDTPQAESCSGPNAQSQAGSADHYADSGGVEGVDTDIEALLRGAVPVNGLDSVPLEVSPAVTLTSPPALQPSTSEPDEDTHPESAQSTHEDQDRKALVQTPGDMSRYAALLADIAPFAPIEGFSAKMCAILKMGLYRFTSLEWSEVNLIDNDQALKECNTLYCMQIVDRYVRHGHYFYLLRFETPAELEELVRYQRIHAPINASSGDSNFWTQLASLEASKSDTLRRAAAAIRSMLSEGVYEYTKSDWVRRTGMSDAEYKAFLGAMATRKMHVNISDLNPAHTGPQRLFRLTVADNLGSVPDLPPIPASIPEENVPDAMAAADTAVSSPETAASDDDRAVSGDCDPAATASIADKDAVSSLQALDAISCKCDSMRIQRLRDYLIHRGSDDSFFTTDDWAEYFNITKTTAEKDIRKAYNLGLLERRMNFGSSVPNAYGYRPVTGAVSTFRLQGFSDAKRDFLLLIYRKYGQSPFTQKDFEDLSNLSRKAIWNKLDEFFSRGLLQRSRNGGRIVYRLAVTPDDHPECFPQQQGELMMAGAG